MYLLYDMHTLSVSMVNSNAEDELWLRPEQVRSTGLHTFFVPAVLLSKCLFIRLFIPSSSVSLSYFILAVPMRKCSGEHSCLSSIFHVALLNDTFFSASQNSSCFGRCFAFQKQNYNNNRSSPRRGELIICVVLG